ncbi:MAG: exosome complex RNA-binding protein Csl4 [Candidatus Micrarchaeota archaeon]
MDKKIVLPGDHLSSAEESEPGENTYSEKDEVWSSASGEDVSQPGRASVKTKGRSITLPHAGMQVYCLITKAGMNKAIAGCIPVAEAESGHRGVEIEAVLSVTAIRNSYVREVRDEVRVGDIIRARIDTVEKTGYEITLKPNDCGVLAAFCPRCRVQMGRDGPLFICGSCGWKDRKKTPLKEGEAPPPEEFRERRREWSPRPPRREGGGRPPDRRGGGRHFGRRPGPGGKAGLILRRFSDGCQGFIE